MVACECFQRRVVADYKCSAQDTRRCAVNSTVGCAYLSSRMHTLVCMNCLGVGWRRTWLSPRNETFCYMTNNASIVLFCSVKVKARDKHSHMHDLVLVNSSLISTRAKLWNMLSTGPQLDVTLCLLDYRDLATTGLVTSRCVSRGVCQPESGWIPRNCHQQLIPLLDPTFASYNTSHTVDMTASSPAFLPVSLQLIPDLIFNCI